MQRKLPYMCVYIYISSTNTLILSSLLPTTIEQYSHHDQFSKIWKCVEGIRVSLLQSVWKSERCRKQDCGGRGGHRWFCTATYFVMTYCSGLRNSRLQVYPYLLTTSFQSSHKMFVHWLPLQIFDLNFLSPPCNTAWIQHSAHPGVEPRPQVNYIHVAPWTGPREGTVTDGCAAIDLNVPYMLLMRSCCFSEASSSCICPPSVAWEAVGCSSCGRAMKLQHISGVGLNVRFVIASDIWKNNTSEVCSEIGL